MIVQCIANSGSALPPEFLCPRDGYTSDTEFGLTVGQEYTVYAMTPIYGHVWYYVLQDHDFDYPTCCPCPLFSIVDGRPSRYWQFNYIRDKRSYGEVHVEIWAFPEWARSQLFYEKLLDGNPEEVAVFATYRRLMDEEF